MLLYLKYLKKKKRPKKSAHIVLLVFSEYIELARSLTDTDNTFCFCMDNSGTGAILVYHHLYEPKQIVKNVLVPTVI